MTKEALVRARQLRRDYGSGDGGTVTALDGIDLDLPAGEFIVLRGPSGCGKSTLLNLIGLLDRASSGELQVNGQDLSVIDRREAAKFRREKVGFLFQDAGLVEPMTVGANVEIPLIYRQHPTGQRDQLIHAALELVGMADRVASSVGELSGGERQRVGLARAWVANPPLLICDEPTAALDADNSLSVAGLLAGYCDRGGTVVCSSHDPIMIERADRVVSMLRGRVEDIQA